MSDKDTLTLTPLHKAVSDNDHVRVAHLLTTSIPVDSRGPGGRTPLHFAVEKENLRIIHLLLAYHADVMTPDHQGQTVLHLSAIKGAVEVLEDLLLSSTLTDIDIRNGDGQTPLHLAITHNHAPVIELLVEHESSPNATNQHGQTPLHLAVSREDLHIATLLVRHGAIARLADPNGRTPLHLAALQGNGALVHLMLAANGDVHKPDLHGRTPLHDAVVGNWPDVARFLVERGANVNAKDILGRTPIHIAVTMGAKIIELMLRSHDTSAPPRPLTSFPTVTQPPKTAPTPAVTVPTPAHPSTAQATVGVETPQLTERLARYEQQIQFFGAAFNALPQQILIVNHDFDIVFINRSACQLSSVSPLQVTGKNLNDCLATMPSFESFAQYGPCAMQERKTVTFSTTLNTPDGPRGYTFQISPLAHRDGQVMGAICTATLAS